MENAETTSIKPFVEGAVEVLSGVLARIETMGVEIEKGQMAYIAVGDGDLRISVPDSHLGTVMGLLADRHSALAALIAEVEGTLT